MRVEIKLPDDKDFLDQLQKLANAENRSRKNWMETVIINAVESKQAIKDKINQLKLNQ